MSLSPLTESELAYQILKAALKTNCTPENAHQVFTTFVDICTHHGGIPQPFDLTPISLIIHPADPGSPGTCIHYMLALFGEDETGTIILGICHDDKGKVTLCNYQLAGQPEWFEQAAACIASHLDLPA